MRDLLNFFISFEKLMKERLVVAFFWLSLIVILMTFFADALAAIYLGPLAGIIKFFRFFVDLLLAVVALRLLCEVAIALFRMNDNLSPDGGKGEAAGIDPIEEARKAAEEAAKRAREMSSNVVSRTKAAVDTTGEAASDLADDAEDTVEDIVEDIKPDETPDLDPDLYATDKDGNIIFNKDGSPRKKPGRRKK